MCGTADFIWVLQITALGDSWATSVSTALWTFFQNSEHNHVEPLRPVSFRRFRESAWYDFFYQWLLLEGNIFSAEMFVPALVSAFEMVGQVQLVRSSCALIGLGGAPSQNSLSVRLCGWLLYGTPADRHWRGGWRCLSIVIELHAQIEAAPWDGGYPAHDRYRWKKRSTIEVDLPTKGVLLPRASVEHENYRL